MCEMEKDMRRSTLISLIAAGTLAATAAGIFAWRRFDSRTYLRYDTMFGTARVYQVEDDQGTLVRLLEVGGIVQSGTYLDERYTELVFEYLKRYDLMFESEKPISRICVLGCGGYDYPEHLIAHHPDVTVDAVEIDPSITAIAQRHFFLDRLIEEFDTESTGRLNLICSDALDHLRTTETLYDAIVNDTYDAGAPPAHLTTPAYAQAVHDRLTPGGLYLTNIVSAIEGPGSAFLHEQVDILKGLFTDVRIIACDPDNLTSEDNVIVTARK